MLYGAPPYVVVHTELKILAVMVIVGTADTCAAAGRRSPIASVIFTAAALGMPAPRASQYTDLPDRAYRAGLAVAVAGGAVDARRESLPVLARDTRDPGRPADLTSAPFAFHVVDTSPPAILAVLVSVIGALPAASVIADAAGAAAMAVPAGARASAAADTTEAARLTRTVPRDR